MKHFLDVDIATKYGVNVAILLENFGYWIKQNEANETNYFDGAYWTFNSRKAYQEMFPYMSEKQIRIAIQKMVDEGLLLTGNYNKSAYDRTLWYALTEKGKQLLQYGSLHNDQMEGSICPLVNIDAAKRANGRLQKGQPIPNINTNIIPDINTDSNNTLARSRKNGSKPVANESPIFITLPLNTGEEWPVTEESVKNWSQLYPAVDVEQQLRNMRGWLESNPAKRKTRNGVARFVTGWLSREQDRGGKVQTAVQQPVFQKKKSAFDLLGEMIAEDEEKERQARDGDYREVTEND